MVSKCKLITPPEEQILTKTRIFYILEFLYIKSKFKTKKGSNKKQLTDKISEIYNGLLENKLDLDKKIIEILNHANDDRISEVTKSRLTTERSKISFNNEVNLRELSSPTERNFIMEKQDIMLSAYNKNKVESCEIEINDLKLALEAKCNEVTS